MKSSQKPAIIQKTTKNTEDLLADHLKNAEHHLIEAVKLFLGAKKVERRPDYSRRLIQAQETITALYREELIRILKAQPKGRVKK